MLNNPIILGGMSLPALTNPGTAADLLTGKQLIDQNGNVLTGTLTPGLDTKERQITIKTDASIHNLDTFLVFYTGKYNNDFVPFIRNIKGPSSALTITAYGVSLGLMLVNGNWDLELYDVPRFIFSAGIDTGYGVVSFGNEIVHVSSALLDSSVTSGTITASATYTTV